MLRTIMHYMEKRLHARDESLRNALPFDWGLEHLQVADSAASQRARLQHFTNESIRDSESFFAPAPTGPSDFDFDGHWLRFESPIQSSFPENNTASGRFFASDHSKAAVIIAPHWNAQPDAYI